MNLRATLSLLYQVASIEMPSICSSMSLARSARRIASRAGAGIAGLILATAFAHASTGEACDKAARRAAAEHGVPFPVLWSITRTETGRSRNGKLSPWPWTVNMEGKGKWFETRHAARAYVEQEFGRGARSFDVGCFQLNYKWHGASFRSIDQMFDPIENARYAAAFLARLYRESGDWSIAAGAYHSRTPEYSRIYRARFDRIYAKFDPADRNMPVPAATGRQRVPEPSRKRVNSYPLLTYVDAPGRNGSLVPLQTGGSQALIVIPGLAEES